MPKICSMMWRKFISFLGWIFALNATALVSIAGWIPHFTGMEPKTYLLWAFIASLPIALLCEIKLGDLDED